MKSLTGEGMAVGLPKHADRMAFIAMAVVAWVATVSGVAVCALRVVGWFTVAVPTFGLSARSPGPATGESRSVVFTAAEVTAPLTAGARALFAVTDLLSLAAVVAVGFAGYLFWVVGRGKPFGSALVRAAAISGPVLALGPLLQSLSGFGAGVIAMAELPDPAGLFPVMSLETGPVLAGLAISAGAFLLARAKRLQSETDGLI